jgi:acetyltransferase-like isoleucine patch superfamily enzyme
MLGRLMTTVGQALRTRMWDKLFRAIRAGKLRGIIYRYTLLRQAGPKLYLAPGITIAGADSITLGTKVSLGPHITLNVEPTSDGRVGSISVGDNVNIGGFGTLTAAESILIEDHVTIAPRVFVTDHQHAYDDPELPVGAQGIARIRPVRICHGAWIGVGVTILQGVTIGRNAVIGANSVVTSSIPDNSVALGAPARIVTGPHSAASTEPS